MGTEFHPVFRDLAQTFQAENLKASAVREDGFAPGVEFVQPSAPGNQFVTGAQVEVIGICRG